TIDNLAITEWVQRGASVYGKETCDSLGRVRISDDGNTVVVGMTNYTPETGDSVLDDQGNCTGNNIGGLRVLDWNGSAWTQRGNDFLGNNSVDIVSGRRDLMFGYARGISKDNNTIIIGGFRFGDEEVRVWDWDSDNKIWKQRGLSIKPEILGTLTHGREVSISDDGNTILVSTPRGDEFKGYIRVFDWNDSAWVQRGDKIVGKVGDNQDGDNLGTSAQLSSDANSIVLGARFNSDGLPMAGAVYVYDWNGSTWVQRGIGIYGQEENEILGAYHGAVDINDTRNTIVIGSTENEEGNGRIRVFDWNDSAWVQRGSNIDGDIDGHYMGYYVSLSNDGNTISSAVRVTGKTTARVYDWNGSAW
ncbi:uncharacterized protein METZ01_LOCUS320186, partial [marine metagenome]